MFEQTLDQIAVFIQKKAVINYICFFDDQEKFFMSSCYSADIEIYLKLAGVGIDSLFLDMPIALIIIFSKLAETLFSQVKCYSNIGNFPFVLYDDLWKSSSVIFLFLSTFENLYSNNILSLNALNFVQNIVGDLEPNI